MPEKYLKIKRSYKKRGASERVAQRKAAMTYNAQRKPGQKPVTRKTK